jgi:glycosyltransferase involved in cell wall biosynthesis
MKVLIVRNAFVYDFGGAERLAVHLAQELSANGLEAIVLSRQPRLLKYAEDKDVRHQRGWWWQKQNWSGKSALIFPVYVAWQILLFSWYVQLLLRLRVDVLHICSKDDFIAGTVAAKLLHKRVVWTDPADLKYIFANHGLWYKNPVGKLVYAASKLADSITVVSHNEKRLIEVALGHPAPSNMIVLYTAGKDESVVPIKREPEDKDAIIFCSTSRLVVAKGILELIQAFNVLSSNSTQYRLWLVGDGPDEKSFIQEAGGNKYIRFIGHTDKPLEYVAACDVFVLPTHNEGFSLSLAEAAMLGKPMVATSVGGNPELVNDKNGCLVPVQDTASLLSAMQRLSNDKALRDTFGRQARKDYVGHFDFGQIVKNELIPLYEN